MRIIVSIKYFFRHSAEFNCMEVLLTPVNFFHQFCSRSADDSRWSADCIKRVSGAITIDNSAPVRCEITLITQ